MFQPRPEGRRNDRSRARSAAAADDARGRPSALGSGPVKPPWLRSVTTAAVIAAHVLVFGILAYSAKPNAISLNSVSMDLVSEGDFFEQEEVAEADDTPPPEAVEEPEIALPPPVVMAPDAVPLPAKKEDVDEIKKKVEQQQVQRAQQRQQAQARRRYGAPEGHAASSGASQATCLAHIAAALRRHTPGSTSLGAGPCACDVPRQSGRRSVGRLGVGIDVGACGSGPANRVVRRAVQACAARPMSARRSPSIDANGGGRSRPPSSDRSEIFGGMMRLARLLTLAAALAACARARRERQARGLRQRRHLRQRKLLRRRARRRPLRRRPRRERPRPPPLRRCRKASSSGRSTPRSPSKRPRKVLPARVK